MKVLLFTHSQDIDGMGCAVLGHQAFTDITVVPTKTFEITSNVKAYIDDNRIASYDLVFVTDLCIKEPVLKEIEENETLKSYLSLAEKYNNYKTVPAYVINRDISNYSKTIVINVGKDDGIKENMPVIADDGLVGYVISVTNNTAKVQTIVDSSSSTSCLTSSTRDNMVCKGTIEETNTLKGTYIANGANVIEGDSIETSGMGGIYPKGIHIGKVKEIMNGKNKTDLTIKVEVSVDFEKLETVLVITK